MNGVGVFLAQGFVFLGEEGLTFQICGADLATKHTHTHTQCRLAFTHSFTTSWGLFLDAGCVCVCVWGGGLQLHLPHTQSRCRAR